MMVRLAIEESVLCPVNTSVQNDGSQGKNPNPNQSITNMEGGSPSYYIKINGSETESNPCTDGTFPHRIQLRVRNRMSAQPAHLTQKRKSNSEESIATDWRSVKSKTLGEEGCVRSLVPFVETQPAVLYAQLQKPDKDSQTYYVRIVAKNDKNPRRLELFNIGKPKASKFHLKHKMIEHNHFYDCLALDSSMFLVVIPKPETKKDIPCLDGISVKRSETQVVNAGTKYKEMVVELPNNLSRVCLARANIPTPVQFQSREPNFQAPLETPSFYIRNINNGNESNPCGSDSDFPDGITLLIQNYFVPPELRPGPGDQHSTIHMTNGEEGIQFVTQEAEGNMVPAQSPMTPVTLENSNPGEENASMLRGVFDTDESGDYRPIPPEPGSLHSMIDANQYGGMIAHPESNGPIMMNSVLNSNFLNSHSWAELSEICLKVPPNVPGQGIQHLRPGADEGVDLNPTDAGIPSGNQPQSITGKIDSPAIDYHDIIAKFCTDLEIDDICVSPEDCSQESISGYSYDTESQTSIGRSELDNSEIQSHYRAVDNHSDYLANQYDYGAGEIQKLDLGRLQRTASI